MNSWSLRNIIWWEFMLSFSILRRCRIWLHVAFFSAVCPVPHATWSFWRPSAGSSKDTLWPCSLWCSLLRLCGMARPACCRFTFYTEFTLVYMNLHEFTWIYMNLHEFTWIYMTLHLHSVYTISERPAWSQAMDVCGAARVDGHRGIHATCCKCTMLPVG